MDIIPALLLIVLFFILLILLTPVKYTVGAEYQGELNYSINARYGLVLRLEMHRRGPNTQRLRICGISCAGRSKKSPGSKIPVKREPKNSRSQLRTLQLFLANRVQMGLWKLFKQVLKACKPNEVILKGSYGFYEPHLTAWLLPCLYSLAAMDETYCIDICPVWDQEYLEGYLVIAGSIIPAQLLWYLMSFVLQASTWRFFSAVRRNKKAVQPF